MFSEELLVRLGTLNRQRGALTTTPAVPLPPRGDPSGPAPGLPRQASADEDLSQLPAGTELHNAWGTHWLRQQSLQVLWPHGAQWLSHQFVQLDQSRSASTIRSRELRALCDSLPAGVVYLDLETCGFSGSMIFLVGLIYCREGQFLLSQLLARNYAEEKAVLQSLWSLVADKEVLVTFNGKSFDWPMVHDRSTLHHLGYDARLNQPAQQKLPRSAQLGSPLDRNDPRPELVHCDLLHHSRRRWKDQLPDCKLQTLERLICRRRRGDDIRGREIPSAYHDFVRSGDAWLIRSVLHHNALDLITLMQLSMNILS